MTLIFVCRLEVSLTSTTVAFTRACVCKEGAIFTHPRKALSKHPARVRQKSYSMHINTVASLGAQSVLGLYYVVHDKPSNLQSLLREI